MANIISDITATSGYTGNAALGGATAGGVTLETRPLENLQQYVFYYNKNLHEEKREDANKRATELAELAKFNPDAALPQDKKAALEAWNQIVAFGNDYARKPLTGSGKDNLNQLWDFKTKINSTLRLVDHVNKRAVSYQTQKAAIDKRTDLTPAQKDTMLKKLDEYAATDVTVDIPTLPESDLKIPEVPKAALQDWETSINLGNDTVQTKVSFFDPLVQTNQANAAVMGLNKLIVSPDSEQYKKASERERLQYDLLAKSNNDFAFWKNLEDISATALAGDGKTNLSDLAQTNPLLKPIYDQRDAFNKWSAEMRRQATRGAFEDHMGRKLNVVGLPADHFIQLPTDKPLTAGQMMMLDQWADSPKLVTKEEQVQHTGTALGYAKLAQDAEQFRLSLGNKSNEDLIGAQAILGEVSDVLKSGKEVGLIEKGKARSVYEISDPNILKEFGDVDKEGRTTNVPDVFTYDPLTKKLQLTYFYKDRAGNILTKADGSRKIQKQIPMAATQWFGQITKRKNPNKDIGGINNILEKVFDAYGRDLQTLADRYGANTPNQTQTTGGASSRISVGGKAKTKTKTKDPLGLF